MNPDGTNPSTNTGAGAADNGGAGAVVPPALDFTSSDPAETTNLSMADSLASAADNLTSAGMAAKEPDNGSIGLGQIGASDPSATMERPDEPLVPAAPVPGSLGSVTSGPAVATGDTQNTAGGSSVTGGFGATSSFGTAGNGGTSGGMTGGNGASSAMSGVAGTASMGAGVTSSTGLNGTAGLGTPGAGSGLGANSASGLGANTASGLGTNAASGLGANATASEPYNPFAAHMSAAGRSEAEKTAPSAKPGQTSSMNVPMGSRPATEKFSGKLADGKKPNLVTVILGILAVVSLVMAIVFAVLWQQALANQKVTYVPPKDDGGDVNQTVAMITCTKNLGMDEAGILAGLADHNMAATANFSDDQLGSVTMLNKYTFVDAAAAEATRTYFDGALVWYGSVAEGAGVSAEPATLDITDTLVTLSLSATPAQLVGDYAEVFGLTTGEDGKVDASRESIQANYEANGFVCKED